MPWRCTDLMSLRKEFVTLSRGSNIPFAELCRRFRISRKTGYKWLRRYREQGEKALQDLSRRPRNSPRRLKASAEQELVALRLQHPPWGARKLRKILQSQRRLIVPSCTTITNVLHRHGLISTRDTPPHTWKRFEASSPNALWQMDFKGHFPTLNGPCHPLTVLDDHSRFNLCLKALPNEQTQGVQEALTYTFQRLGLPDSLITDNGSPWGSDSKHPYTPLTLWLLRLGIRVLHSRPYHPQTLGKDERFHRTLNRELITSRQWRDCSQVQHSFDSWRHQYNFVRPHDALGLEVPASRYQPSLRPFPVKLPEFHYPQEAQVRKVQNGGFFSFKGKEFKISKCFAGFPVGILPTLEDGIFSVLFCNHKVVELNLKTTT
jgi:transposase InsO family protein